MFACNEKPALTATRRCFVRASPGNVSCRAHLPHQPLQHCLHVLVHRAMNGRGSFLSALGGLGLGWVVMLVELGIASAVCAPTLALEWSHSNAIEESSPTFSFSAAPLPQGGRLAASLRS